MKKALSILFLSLVALPLTSFAETKSKDDNLNLKKAKDEPVHTWLNNLSGTMALATDYMFRGISQTNNGPAVQGGITYTFPISVYLSLWGTNARYLAPNGAQVTTELDTLIGYQGGYGDHFSFDINAIRYFYPHAYTANYNELNSLWTLYFFTLGLSYTGNYAGYHGSGTYVNGTVDFDIPPRYVFNLQDVSIAGEYGHYSLARVGGNSYNDFRITLAKQINTIYNFAVMWAGTDGRAKLGTIDDNRFVGNLTATF